MDVEFGVVEDPALHAAFEALGDELSEAAMQRALTRAAAPIVEAAKANAPRGNPPSKRPLWTTIRVVLGFSKRERRRRRSLLAGQLGRVSQTTGQISGRNLTRAEGASIDAEGRAVVSVTSTAPHALLVEYGHTQVVRRRVRVGRLKSKRTELVSVGHVPAHPYMRPAWDSTRDMVLRLFRGELYSAVTSAVRRALTKGAASLSHADLVRARRATAEIGNTP